MEKQILIQVRKAARELAANIIYQQLIRDYVKELYSAELGEYQSKAEADKFWAEGLRDREDFDRFSQLSGLHMALLRDALKKGQSQEELSDELDRRFENPRHKTNKTFRRLSHELTDKVFSLCLECDFCGELFAAASELMDEPDASTDQIFPLSQAALAENTDISAELKSGIFDYAEQLVRGAERMRNDTDLFIRNFSDKYDLYRIEYILKAYIRIACYEMAECDDVDFKVAINEALNGIKTYSGEESVRFANSLLQDYYDSLNTKRD